MMTFECCYRGGTIRTARVRGIAGIDEHAGGAAPSSVLCASLCAGDNRHRLDAGSAQAEARIIAGFLAELTWAPCRMGLQATEWN